MKRSTISTADPRFDPRGPLIINGYVFVPAENAQFEPARPRKRRHYGFIIGLFAGLAAGRAFR